LRSQGKPPAKAQCPAGGLPSVAFSAKLGHMDVPPKIPVQMTVAEFLAWNSPPGPLRQLVDGEPREIVRNTVTHGAIQSELGSLIASHLAGRASSCSVVMTPGVIPRVQSETNFRVPDLAITCSSYETEEYALADPVLVIEILSPNNQAETWANVWAYTTIPSVQEILVLKTASIGAELLRRNQDGSWPNQPASICAGDDLTLESIGFRIPIAAAYRTTRLATNK